MSERTDLLESIAETISDYREGEVRRPNPVHVERWIKQFGKDVQEPLLRELDHVLTRTYISRQAMVAFVGRIVASDRLTGGDPRRFWLGTSLLDIQQHGHSQADMLALLADCLQSELRLRLDQCGGATNRYVYLDDVLFSGSRISNDVGSWIAAKAPAMADVHIVVHSSHTLGEFQLKTRLRRAVTEAEKEISFRLWRMAKSENRKKYRDSSTLLWPIEVADDPDTEAYRALPQRFPFEPRRPGGPLGPFSSEEGRQLLEREFLVAGARIRASCSNPKDTIRPLGFSQFGLGFGSMIVTYRNCPNNTPLALWWGVGTSQHGARWYPLFPRKTYGDEAGTDDLSF